MTVVVTGAAGLLGRHVVAALRADGQRVRAVDRRAADDGIVADVTDLGQAMEVCAGARAVIHLAAIPRPTGATGHTVFTTNVGAAHAVAEAVRLLGIGRVVSASSFSVLGWPFNPRPLRPAYLPVDEAHPLAPQEPYALSKRVTEEVWDALARRTDTRVVSLRMPWIQTPETFTSEVAAHRHEPRVGPGGLWAYLDARDAADAVVAALSADVDGHRAVYLSAPDTVMAEPTADLVAEAFGDVEWRVPVHGHDPVIATAAAEALLGLAARRSWRDYDVQREEHP